MRHELFFEFSGYFPSPETDYFSNYLEILRARRHELNFELSGTFSGPETKNVFRIFIIFSGPRDMNFFRIFIIFSGPRHINVFQKFIIFSGLRDMNYYSISYLVFRSQKPELFFEISGYFPFPVT